MLDVEVGVAAVAAGATERNASTGTLSRERSANGRNRVVATVLTTVSVLVTIAWQASPDLIPFRRFDLWIWFVCCGVVLLSLARFSIRHAVPFPEIGLLSFPFLFEAFFRFVCPTTRVGSVDELLWCFDSAFGYPQPLLGRLLVSSPLLFWTCKVVWSSLPVLFVVMYLAVPESARRRFVAAVVCTGVLILPLYALCPAAGPVYLFREQYPYPDGLPIPLLNPQVRTLAEGLPLNTTPSGHMTWTLLLLWFAVKYCRKRVAILFAGVLAGTIVATIGLGEHYVIDLILAFPYAAAVLSLAQKEWRRFGVLLAIVVFSLIGLRQGWMLDWPSAQVWLLCLGLIFCPLLAGKNLLPHYVIARQPAPEGFDCVRQTQ